MMPHRMIEETKEDVVDEDEVVIEEVVEAGDAVVMEAVVATDEVEIEDAVVVVHLEEPAKSTPWTRHRSLHFLSFMAMVPICSMLQGLVGPREKLHEHTTGS